jgi:hypothetical protein
MLSGMERLARAHRSLLPSCILATASLTVQQVMIPALAIPHPDAFPTSPAFA